MIVWHNVSGMSDDEFFALVDGLYSWRWLQFRTHPSYFADLCARRKVSSKTSLHRTVVYQSCIDDINEGNV